LPAELLEELAASLREDRVLAALSWNGAVGKPAAAGNIGLHFAEGQIGDCLYLIESGCAEVATAGPTGLVLLASLESGDLFGEIALLNSTRRRQATVKALTALVTLSLSAAAFERALAAFPEARLDLATTAEALLTAKYLKKKSPHTQ